MVQARDGFVYVFLPPLEKLETFVELVGLLDRAAAATGTRRRAGGLRPAAGPPAATPAGHPRPGRDRGQRPARRQLARAGRPHPRPCTRIARDCRLGTETFAVDGRHSGTGGGNHLTLGGPEPRPVAAAPPARPAGQPADLLAAPPGAVLPVLRAVSSARPARRPGSTRAARRRLYELEIAFAEIAARPGPGQPSGDPALGGGPGAAPPADRHHRQHPPGRVLHRQAVQPRLAPRPARAARAARLRDAAAPRDGAGPGAAGPRPGRPLRRASRTRRRWSAGGPRCTSGSCCRTSRWPTWPRWSPTCARTTSTSTWPGSRRSSEFRFPRIGDRPRPAGSSWSCGTAIEPWHVLGEEASAGGTARYVDSSTERLQVAVRRLRPGAAPADLQRPAGAADADRHPGEYVAGVRYRAWKPWSALHPTLGDRLAADTSTCRPGRRGSRSAARPTTWCIPGGRSYDHPPVNAQEAEARRARRFEPSGHTTGVIDVDALDAWLARRGADESRALSTCVGSRGRGSPPGLHVPAPGAAGDRPQSLPGRGGQATCQPTPTSTSSLRPTAPLREGWPALLDGLDRVRPTTDLLRCPARGRPAAGGRQRHLHPEPGLDGLDRRPAAADQGPPPADRRAAAVAARPAAAGPRRPGVGRPRGRGGAAGRAAGRDPGRPLRRAAAAGPAAPPAGGGVRPRGVPARRGRQRGAWPGSGCS